MNERLKRNLRTGAVAVTIGGALLGAAKMRENTTYPESSGVVEAGGGYEVNQAGESNLFRIKAQNQDNIFRAEEEVFSDCQILSTDSLTSVPLDGYDYTNIVVFDPSCVDPIKLSE